MHRVFECNPQMQEFTDITYVLSEQSCHPWQEPKGHLWVTEKHDNPAAMKEEWTPCCPLLDHSLSNSSLRRPILRSCLLEKQQCQINPFQLSHYLYSDLFCSFSREQPKYYYYYCYYYRRHHLHHRHMHASSYQLIQTVFSSNQEK